MSLYSSEHLRDCSLPRNLPFALVNSKVDPLFKKVACDQPAATVNEHLDLLREKGALRGISGAQRGRVVN